MPQRSVSGTPHTPGGAHSGDDGEEGCWDDDDGYDERLQRALEFVERV